MTTQQWTARALILAALAFAGCSPSSSARPSGPSMAEATPKPNMMAQTASIIGVTESDVGTLIDIALGSKNRIQVAQLLNIYGPVGDSKLKGMAQIMQIVGPDQCVARQIGLSDRANKIQVGDRVKVLIDEPEFDQRVAEDENTSIRPPPKEDMYAPPEQPAAPVAAAPTVPETAPVPPAAQPLQPMVATTPTTPVTTVPTAPVSPSAGAAPPAATPPAVAAAPSAPVTPVTAPAGPTTPAPIVTTPPAVAVAPTPAPATQPAVTGTLPPEIQEQLSALVAENKAMREQITMLSEETKRKQSVIEMMVRGVVDDTTNTELLTPEQVNDVYDRPRQSDSQIAKRPALSDRNTIAALDKVASLSSELDQVKSAREKLDADLLANRKQLDELYEQISAQELARLEAERALYDFSVRVLQLSDKSTETVQLQQRLREYLAYLDTQKPTDDAEKVQEPQ